MEPDHTPLVERLLTWLGMWGGMRMFSPIAAALVGAVVLLEGLVPAAAQVFPRASLNTIHFLAVGVGLLLGVIGHFVAEFWDRVPFAAYYGPKGRWLDAVDPPFLVFPAGESLKKAHELMVQAILRKPEKGADIDREAIKVARRQTERWERIERPLILARFVRGFLWPCVFAACLAGGGALVASLLGAGVQAPRFLLLGVASLLALLLLLVPYTRLRVEFLLRLYRDVSAHAAHSTKRKPERR